MTQEGGYLIRFFFGFVSNVRGEAWDRIPSDTWLEEMIEASHSPGGSAPKEGEKFLTLSICSYEFSNARFVLLGILEEQA